MPKCKRSIKQTGCSNRRKRQQSRKMRGGDAFNMVPAKNIYPLNNYAIDTQRMMRGGNKSRKYMYSGGSAPSWFTTTTNTQPIASLWGTNNRFYV